MTNIDHRPDCQLLTVTTYGLCTCDFDDRMRSEELWEAKKRRAVEEMNRSERPSTPSARALAYAERPGPR